MAIFPRLSLDESTAEPKSLAKSRNEVAARPRTDAEGGGRT